MKIIYDESKTSEQKQDYQQAVRVLTIVAIITAPISCVCFWSATHIVQAAGWIIWFLSYSIGFSISYGSLILSTALIITVKRNKVFLTPVVLFYISLLIIALFCVFKL